MIGKVALLIFSFFVMLSVASLILNAPLLIAYIKSDSMSPTLQKNDLVFINVFDRNFNEEDIIVFNSYGKWICHRIVKISAEGFITKGDANIATDQFSGKPAVLESEVIGKIVSINGDPVNIQLGSSIGNAESFFGQNKFLVFFILAAGGFLLLSRGEKRRRKNKYLRIKTSTIFMVSSLLIIAVFSLANVMAFEKREISYGTTSAGGLREEWVLPGEKFSRQIEFRNGGSYPYYYIVSSGSPNLRLESQDFILYPGESQILEAQISAPEDTNLHTERIYAAKYIPLLPAEVIRALSFFPYLPILVMDLEIAILLMLVYSLGNFEGEVLKIRKRWRS